MPAYNELTYTLTENEFEQALKVSGYYHIGSKRSIIETVVLAILFVFFTVSFFMTWEWFNLAMAAVCAVVCGFLYFLPKYDRKKKARGAEKEIRLRLYPTVIYYYGGEGTVEILLKQAKIRYDHKNEVYAVMPENGGFLAIPARAFQNENKMQIHHQLITFAEQK